MRLLMLMRFLKQVFFHYSELPEGVHRVRVGDEFDFVISDAPGKSVDKHADHDLAADGGKKSAAMPALRLRSLPAHTVVFEDILVEAATGSVVELPPAKVSAANSDGGVVLMDIEYEGAMMRVPFGKSAVAELKGVTGKGMGLPIGTRVTFKLAKRRCARPAFCSGFRGTDRYGQ
eukprot:6214026-Pleurochrysis_carterae.AAC.4